MAAPLIWTQPPPPPRQRSLGRAEIVAAAIGLADAAGSEALTMKAVAGRLGPYSPMALYRYVYSKDGLVDLMVDAVSGQIPLPRRPSGDWRADLRTLATDTRAVIKAHPWFAELVQARPPAAPHLMRRTEFMLTVLVDAGAELHAAMTYAALIDRHVFGGGLQDAEEERLLRRHGLSPAPPDPAALSHPAFLDAVQPIRELAAADGELPHLTAWLSDPSGPAPDEQFGLGLTFLLDGIATQLPDPKVVHPN